MTTDKFFELSGQKKAVITISLIILFLFCAKLMLFSDWLGLFSHKSHNIRYRVTVTVDTPEGPKTGTAVHEAYTYSEMRLVPGQGGTFYGISKGEAIPVDLGARGDLFLLLGGSGEAALVIYNLKDGKKSYSLERRHLNRQYFVMFSDIDDPTTAEEVATPDLYEIMKSKGSKRAMHTFEQALGTRVKLESVTYEITNDPVTWGIEKRLPWLVGSAQRGGGIRDSRQHPNNLGLYLRQFSVGGAVL